MYVFISTFSVKLSVDDVYFFITVHCGWCIYCLYWILCSRYCAHDNDVSSAIPWARGVTLSPYHYSY